MDEGYSVVGFFAGLLTFLVALVAAAACWIYLTELDDSRKVIAGVVTVVGFGFAILVRGIVRRICVSRSATFLVVLLLAVAVIAPPVSMLYPGTITYARFGLVVYGIIPVPALDVTIGPRGALWFRDKSHLITREEIDDLISPEVEVVIIGTGWQGGARVEPSVKEIEGPEIRIELTPDAYELYNRLKKEGRVVVLLAHSTC